MYQAQSAEVEVTIEVRKEIVRVSSLIRLLNIAGMIICPKSITEIWECTKGIEVE